MMLGQPESVPLARSEDSFSDDGLRSEPSMGSLQELEYVDRWPSEAPPPPEVPAACILPQESEDSPLSSPGSSGSRPTREEIVAQQQRLLRQLETTE